MDELARALNQPERFTLATQLSAPPPPSPMVFVSYSRADAACLERLRVHLRPLQRESAIAYWDDGSIVAGERWRDRIEAALARARVAVLLVSADFLASDFVVQSELPVLLAAAEERGTSILPSSSSPAASCVTPGCRCFSPSTIRSDHCWVFQWWSRKRSMRRSPIG